jgi:beta-N-acetylhexosaminidase
MGGEQYGGAHVAANLAASRHHRAILQPVKSRRLIRALLVVAAAVGLATQATGSQHRGLSGARRTGEVRAALTQRTGRSADSPAQKLSLAQLAGQRIVYAYAGLQPPSALLARIRKGEAAGVIFFGSNISSPGQLRAVVRELQRANASSPVHAPLLMMTDQEGGLVRRLPGAPALSEKQIGGSPDGVALAAQAGTGAGRNLRGAGLNVNLAPVVDVARRTGDFIDQYQRSYGMSPSTVATLAAAFVAAQQRTGVAATAKHFPGLGAATTGQDTDAGAVTLRHSLSVLRAIDEAPFRAAIAAGVGMVMASWAVYPALDSVLPAGLSSTVIEGELRARLGFRGVTITDALGAGALAGFGTVAQRGVLAAQAGADLLLCAVPNPADNRPGLGISVLDGITLALMNGRLSRASAVRAAARVVSLRLHPAGGF